MLRKAEEGAGPLGSAETGRFPPSLGWSSGPGPERAFYPGKARRLEVEWGRPREGPIPRVTVGAGPTGNVFGGSRKRGGARGAAPLATGPEAGEGRGEQSRIGLGAQPRSSRAWRLSWRLSWRRGLGPVRRPRGVLGGAGPLEGAGPGRGR